MALGVMEQHNLKDHILRYGLLLGLAEIVLTLGTYLAGVKYMVSYWTSIIGLLAIIAIMAASGVKWKKMHRGILVFKRAFLLMFAVYAVSSALLLLFNITLYNAIDPALPGQMKEEISDKMITTMERIGTPDESIEEALSSLDSMEESYEPGPDGRQLWLVAATRSPAVCHHRCHNQEKPARN
ncbi:MAG: DUF4199 domain-containing protein [Flavobacteriales bacterium]